MQKILKFKRSFRHYKNLLKIRQTAGDFWGVLDAIKNAKSLCKNKQEKQKLTLMLAQTYYEMGQFDQSTNEFLKLASTEIFRASALFGIGRNLASKRIFSLALDYFEGAIRWDVLNMFGEAIASWCKYLEEQNKNSEEACLLSAKLMLQKKDYIGARKLLGEMKTSAKTLALLAFCEFCQEDFSMAKQKAKESLREDEKQSLSYIVLAKASEKDSLKSKEKHIKKLLEQEFCEKEDLKRVALFLCYEKDFDNAIFYFQKLLEVDEFNPENHLLLGLCYYNLKREQEALLCVSKSIWLCEDNPVYEFFYDAIKTKELGDFCKVEAKLPKEIETQKVENLMKVFFGGNLSKEIDKSFVLLKNILWGFGLHDLALTEISSKSLLGSKNKEAICLIKKIMLMVGPTKRQKYVILKEALKSELFENYNFVCSYVYSSFRIKKAELKQFSKNFLEGVCSAISYAECFYPKLMLLTKILKKASKNKTNSFVKNMSAKVIACFLLKESEKAFLGACNFFGVEQKFVEEVFSCAQKNEVESEN